MWWQYVGLENDRVRARRMALLAGLLACCALVVSGIATWASLPTPVGEEVGFEGGLPKLADATAEVTAPCEPSGAAAVARTAVEMPAGSRMVRVRVVRDLGDGELRPFPPGEVTVRADAPGSPNWHHALRPPLPAEFAVPEGTTEVRLCAGHYGTSTCRLPDTWSGVLDLGTIVLEVGAVALLRVWNAPALLEDALVAEGLVCGQHLCGRAPLRRRQDHLEARIPFVTGSTCELRLFSTRAGFVCNLPRAQRYPGIETDDDELVVDVDLAALPSATVRILGVPVELLPHLELLWDGDGGHLRDAVADEHGELRMIGLPRGLPTETSRLYVRSAGFDKVPLRTPQGRIDLRFQDGAEVLVTPEHDLLGVAACAPNAVAFQLAIGEVEFRRPARDVHIVSAKRLAETPLLSVKESDIEPRLVATQDLIVDGALRRVPAATVPATGTLVVRPRVPCADPGRYMILLEDLDTGMAAGVPWRDGAFRCDRLPAGRYRVERKWRFSTVEVLAEELRLARGASVTLTTTLEDASQRVGSIVNWSLLEPEARPVGIEIDGLTWAKPDENGGFSFVAPAMHEFELRVGLKYADGSVREPVVASDSGCLELTAPRLVVVPIRSVTLEGAHPCSIRIGDGPVIAVNGRCLLAEGEVARGVWQGVPPDVLLSLQGVIVADYRAYAGGRWLSNAYGWFELRATKDPQPVDVGRGTRFVAVDVRRPVTSWEVHVHGPDGWPSLRVADGVQAGAVQVLVVDGTSAIEVVCDGVSRRYPVDADRILVE